MAIVADCSSHLFLQPSPTTTTTTLLPTLKPDSLDLDLLERLQNVSPVSTGRLRENNFKPFEEEKYLSHVQESVAGAAGLNLTPVCFHLAASVQGLEIRL